MCEDRFEKMADTIFPNPFQMNKEACHHMFSPPVLVSIYRPHPGLPTLYPAGGQWRCLIYTTVRHPKST